ncbi:hypothetical protein GCM10010420_07310 [Streptomyces glaucosporus]|uniref:Uncharacterized protein n=1 Tax=Streptomyces glaucosporus TaxID=284044 RepID=A0ABN3HSG3_9ACTN
MGIFRSPAAAARAAANVVDHAAATLGRPDATDEEKTRAVLDARAVVAQAQREGATDDDITAARNRG